MKINVISRDNGVGLSRDLAIIIQLLTEAGHEPLFCEFGKPIDFADANIFIELLTHSYISKSRCNILIPNPEWYDLRWRQFLPRFQGIWCKTRSAMTAFTPMNRKCSFISFTSSDRYRPGYIKDFNKYLHVAGKSGQKGTEIVWETWKQNPDFPHLTIVQDKNKYKEREHLKNLTYIYDHITETELLKLQNECGIHICPSEAEGFGHYIMEAMSVQSVPIATNGLPMNELVTTERGILCEWEKRVRQRFAMSYFVSVENLRQAVETASKLHNDQLTDMGILGRKFFLENDVMFRRLFIENAKMLHSLRHTTKYTTNIRFQESSSLTGRGR